MKNFCYPIFTRGFNISKYLNNSERESIIHKEVPSGMLKTLEKIYSAILKINTCWYSNKNSPFCKNVNENQLNFFSHSSIYKL